MNREELITALLSDMHSGRHKQENRNEGKRSFWFTLNYLYDRRDSQIHPSDLCSALGVTTARITALLNQLEEEGLISRSAARDDRRKICVALTEDGLRLIEEHNRKHRRDIEHLIDLVGEADAEAYLRVRQAISDIRKEHGGHKKH